MYDSIPTTEKAARTEHAQVLGVKQTYPDIKLPYHNRPIQCIVDGMHTIKGVVCNIMDVIYNRKRFRIPALELSQASLKVADQRYSSLNLPRWFDLPNFSDMFSNPKSLKSHDWKQVRIIYDGNIRMCFGARAS